MLKNIFTVRDSSYKKGFTLIELLVVLGILGILAAALLAAINPIEQLNKSQDASMEQLAAEMTSADSRYYTANSAQPAACAGLSSATLSSTAANCVTALITSGELKGTFSQAPDRALMVFTTPSGQTPTDAASSTVCFQPKSHSVQANSNTRYSATGGNGVNCLATGGASVTCYWCAQ